MFFDVYGPFEIALDDNGQVTASQIDLWEEVRVACAKASYTPDTALSVGIGCYVFGLKYRSAIMPWYVGMTVAQAGFRGEIFERHKLDHYNMALKAKPHMTPVMFLFPLLTGDQHYATGRKNHVPLIRWVEKMLFGAALAQNPDCMNKRDTKFLRRVQVAGVFNHRPPGREKAAVEAVREMFGTWR